MNILYNSCTISEKHFYKLFDEKSMPGQQVQKYHRLLMSGLIKNSINVLAISSVPINRSNYRRIFLNLNNDAENGINYIYPFSTTFPIVRNLIGIIGQTFYTLKYILINKTKTFIVCDVLNISSLVSTLLASLLTKVKTVAIVTDLPMYIFRNEYLSSLLEWFISRFFDSYVLLTDDMNEYMNIMKKPFIVIEGHSDINMSNYDNKLSEKYEPSVVLYAGAINRNSGVNTLVEAFKLIENENYELHLYGSGDYVNELLLICEKHPKIKYFGTKKNKDIILEELKATLLVNPRPSNENYARYSFPSKNLEYMASGTPLVTTRLPGLPKSYTNYLFQFDEEDPLNMSRKLKSILCTNREELSIVGKKAKLFILEEKNYINQSKKIKDLIKSLNEC